MKIAINALYSHLMKLIDYISNDYKALDLSASAESVKHFFKNLPFSHFPIVENGMLVGMLAKADIIHFRNDTEILRELQYYIQFYRTDVPDSCIDLIRLFAQFDTDILPITNEKNEYLGYFELDEVLGLFYNSPFFKQASTTLVIGKETSKYSMSEIAQIIESNNIALLGMYLSSTDENHSQITLRIDTENVNEVIQSLRRYDYEVVSQNKDDLLMEQLKQHSDYLHKYLNI